MPNLYINNFVCGLSISRMIQTKKIMSANEILMKKPQKNALSANDNNNRDEKGGKNLLCLLLSHGHEG